MGKGGSIERFFFSWDSSESGAVSLRVLGTDEVVRPLHESRRSSEARAVGQVSEVAVVGTKVSEGEDKV